MADIPFIKGTGCQFDFFFNGPRLILYPKSWELGPNITKVQEGVNGEDADRLDNVYNFCDMQIESYVRDGLILNACIQDIKNNRAGAAPFKKAAGVRLRVRDGSRVAFICREMVLDDWKFRAPGRDQNAMITIPVRFRFFDNVQATPG